MECDACKNGPDAVLLKEAEDMVNYGWYAHYTFDQDDDPYHTNIHTHGLAEKNDHPDFQICYPLDPKVAHGILWTLAERVKKGEKFLPNHKYSKVLQNGYDVFITTANECRRLVLRVILPDSSNHLDPDTIDPKFRKQYEGTSYRRERRNHGCCGN